MTDVADRTVLVAGAAGVIGTYAAAEYAKQCARVLGVSRRAVPGAAYEHLRVDLADPVAPALPGQLRRVRGLFDQLAARKIIPPAR